MKPINQIGRLKENHIKSYEESLILKEAEEVKIIPKETSYSGWIWVENNNVTGGWVPEYYIETIGNISKTLCDYDSTELDAVEKEQVYVHYEVLEWLYCTNLDGNKGWLPKEKVNY